MATRFLKRFLKDFTNLLEGEVILHVKRKHLWLHMTSFLKTIFHFFIPFVFIAGGIFFFEDIKNIFSENMFLITLVILSSIVFFAFFISIWKIFINYKYDILIITNIRILEIDQNFLFDRRVDSIYIKDVVNMVSVRDGILPTLLNYGTLDIKTAAEVKDFVVDYIPQPAEIIQIIQNQQQVLRNHKYDHPHHPYNIQKLKQQTKVTNSPQNHIFSDDNYKKLMRSHVIQQIESVLSK